MDKQAAIALRTFALAHGEIAFAHLVTAALGGEPVTADTVTDEDIREMERSLNSAIVGAERLGHHVKPDEVTRLKSERDACITALHEHDYPSARIGARARCAEIINARRTGEAWAIERVTPVLAIFTATGVSTYYRLDVIRATDTTRPDDGATRKAT